MRPAPLPPTLLARSLARLVTAACRRPRTILVTALLLAGASAVAFHARMEYRTQRSDLINPDKDYQARWHKYLAEFGDEDDMVAVVRGPDPARMRAALDALGDEVRQHPRLFDRLFYRVDLRPLRDRALLLLPADQIRSIQDNLARMGPLLEPAGPLPIADLAWRSLTLGNLLRQARATAGRARPGEPLSPADEQFLTQLLATVRSATATLEDPAAYCNPWGSLMPNRPQGDSAQLDEPQYFFSGDNTLAFLLCRPVKEAGSFTAAEKSVAALRAILAGLRPRFPDLEFGLTGMPVLETDEMVAAQRDTGRASWLAIVGVTLLFMVAYRGFWYPLLTVGTLLIGTAWAMGWMTATVGHLNILSATFAVMLIGMGDYGVLWVMRYEQERRHGLGVEPALLRACAWVGAGTLTAALTTALAFFAAALADFQAVAELGWIAGSGVLLCALACFTVLPAALTLFDRRRPGTAVPGLLPFTASPPHRPAAYDPWLPRLARRAPWVVAGGVALTAVLAVCAGRVRYDHNLLHLQAPDLDSVKWENTLIDHTAGASWRALSYTATAAEALELKAKFETLPEVSRVVEVASLVPPDQDAKLGLLRDVRRRLTNLPPRGQVIPHGRPSATDLQSLLTVLLVESSGLSEGQPLWADLRRAFNALADRMTVTDAAVAEDRLQRFEDRMTTDLATDLHRLRDVSTPAPITLADLPPALRERFIGRSGAWLLQVFCKDSLWEFGPLEHFAQQIQTVDPEATGKPFGTVEGLKAMKHGFEKAGTFALAAIVLILWRDFRDPRRTLLALAPLAAGLTLALGVMGLCGVPLNPANMIGLPLILGVGVDNGVHVLHDYLEARREGRSMFSRAIGRGVLVKACTTMIGFGTLMISSQRGLMGLGFCLTLGVACCMVTALVFLPAVLHLAHRRPAAAPPVAGRRAA